LIADTAEVEQKMNLVMMSGKVNVFIKSCNLLAAGVPGPYDFDRSFSQIEKSTEINLAMTEQGSKSCILVQRDSSSSEDSKIKVVFALAEV